MSLNIGNVFDANFYRAANSDLAGLNDAQALSHFQAYGLNEGRRFSPLVDLSFYRDSNPDLAKYNNSQLLNHLENYGVAEGRSFSPIVDLNYNSVFKEVPLLDGKGTVPIQFLYSNVVHESEDTTKILST